ncbi:Similar to phosphoglycolate phosphatase, clustered with ribosomal large subunit pseudouridine synthase C [hydrothermal vent metagenome]|uniref:Similar to phosphoglycolate phosphatase, clustered with ribosomal large subunit pseudouridine synthase C n=1 Tax=hydrothermal vent metagenome TaxID=652676 RepID=A0A3B0X208_9ZZZZ
MHNTLPYKVLIFDWDGTLMDSVARIVDCLRKSAEQVLGEEKRADDELKDVIGLGLREAIMQLHPSVNEKQISEMSDAYRYQYMEVNTTSSVLFNGVENLLGQLEEQGYWLAVATGKGRQGLDQVLELTGLGPRFHITRCASETFSKPHPLMLEEILQQLGLNANEALMIGDTEYDMEMAKNANMDRLGVDYGVHPSERLMLHNPIGCISNIEDLSGFLQQLKN